MDENLDFEFLQHGEIEIKGEFLWGSNYTFLVNLCYGGINRAAVYKPSKGQQPLWDFPAESLAHREAAAFLVSQALKWDFVPVTAYRENGPLGPGSLQFFIEHNPEYHYFNFTRKDRQRLRPVVVFDILVNNADRKGSHLLIGGDKRLWLIDHGLCFHREDKLRTVLWDFVGEPVPASILESISQFYKNLVERKEEYVGLYNELNAHLDRFEIEALLFRAERLIKTAEFPRPDPARRPFPWPQI
jgi:uncharacterized repeat protein (TIGR03843 family)